MDFLKYVSPDVDWKEGKVTTYVGIKKFILPTCNINRSATIIRSQNSLLKIQIVIKIVQGLNYHLILLVLKIVYTWHSNKMP